MSRTVNKSPDDLLAQYQDNRGRADRLRDAVVVQLAQLFATEEITLGVPVESRVKEWSSIEEKIQRKELVLENVCHLHDLVGIRIILLFKGDLEKVQELVTKTFKVISSEDTSRRLGDSEFGYQSQHFVVRIPKNWLNVPVFSSLGDLYIELQIRTLAQHIWAAASHKLQYKNEAGVPPPLRRTINRVSALLETVDLEFERVLDERKKYVVSGTSSASPGDPFNVDSLAAYLASKFPAENKKSEEDYAELLSDVTELEVNSIGMLEPIISRHMEFVMDDDKKRSDERKRKKSKNPEIQRRISHGVFYTHTGLARTALRKEFGAKAMGVFSARQAS